MPLGKLEDVPLMVEKFYILVDFVVFEIDEYPNVPIILGRSFLATTAAIINMKNGKLMFEVGDKHEAFSFTQIMKSPSYIDDCMRIDIL